MSQPRGFSAQIHAENTLLSNAAGLFSSEEWEDVLDQSGQLPAWQAACFTLLVAAATSVLVSRLRW